MPLGRKVGLSPGHIVLHGDPTSPHKGDSPNFRPMSIVAKRSPISATAEHLLIYSSGQTNRHKDTLIAILYPQ